MSTSSCNPFKLSRYSTSGLELCATLQSKANTLQGALGALSSSGSVYVPSLGEADATMLDLAVDWFHLDEFAGDVANGFFAANQSLLDRPPRPGQYENMVLTLDDDTIFQMGHVGYADRDEAIAAANDLADRVREMQENGASDEEIDAILSGADRGQFDPAFSVTFVEAVGVQGLVDIGALIGGQADPDHLQEQPEYGLALLAPFAQTLTTALDTLPGIEQIDRHDLANDSLADGERLGQEFVQSLTTDFYGDGYDDEFYLSLILSETEPPTAVAVDIANNRLSRLFEVNNNFEPDFAPTVWGDHSGIASNFSRMLASNEDASAQWLGHEWPDGVTNMELAMTRGHDFFNDSGEAIADVVENGVTHWDDDYRVPLMNEAIDVIGGDMDEIRNFYMEEALVSGVEMNMDVIADRATLVGSGPLGDSDNQAATIQNTHAFLRELMGSGDPAIGARVYSATLDFVHDELHGAGPGESLGSETTRVGAVTSIVTEADINAEVGEAEERAARRQAFLDGFGQVVDSTIGLIPGGGTVSDLGTDALGWGADALLEQFEDNDSVDGALANAADYRKATQDMITLALANHEYATGDLTATEVLAATGDAGATGDVDFFVDGTSGDKRPIKPLDEMSDEERAAYLRWVNSEQVIDLITDERTQAGQAADDVQDLVDGRN